MDVNLQRHDPNPHFAINVTAPSELPGSHSGRGNWARDMLNPDMDDSDDDTSVDDDTGHHTRTHEMDGASSSKASNAPQGQPQTADLVQNARTYALGRVGLTAELQDSSSPVYGRGPTPVQLPHAPSPPSPSPPSEQYYNPAPGAASPPQVFDSSGRRLQSGGSEISPADPPGHNENRSNAHRTVSPSEPTMRLNTDPVNSRDRGGATEGDLADQPKTDQKQPLEKGRDDYVSDSSSDATNTSGPQPLSGDRILSSLDVAAFIVNKQIGTGIFTKPVTVLILCGDRKVAFGLWVAGFAASFLSALVYLRFSHAFFWTGGELIFLDETFRRKNLPNLLVFTVYSVFFIAIYTTATNGTELARQILYCADAPAIVEAHRDQDQGRKAQVSVNVPMQSFIAIVALGLISLVHYRSRSFGRFLNKTAMLIKICIVMVVIIAGAIQASKKNIFNLPPGSLDKAGFTNSIQARTTAMIHVLFTYQGWENASFVLGEVRNYEEFRFGIFLAVCTVGTLYIMVNGVVLASVSGTPFISTYVPELFGFSVPAVRIWSILIAVSSAGNLISVIYTCSRVKQVIGKANILPWSRLWARVSPNFGTPTGGLILHWIFSTISIIACSRIKSSDGYSYPGILQVYGHAFFGVLVAGALLFLPRTISSASYNYKQQRNSNWQLSYSRSFFTPKRGDTKHKHQHCRRHLYNAGIAVSYLGLNAYIVIAYVVPPYDQPDLVKGWIAIAVIGGISVVGLGYYLLLFAFENSAFCILWA